MFKCNMQFQNAKYISGLDDDKMRKSDLRIFSFLETAVFQPNRNCSKFGNDQLEYKISQVKFQVNAA